MTTRPPHQNPAINPTPRPLRPPTKHQLALMIWLAVFPTLLVLNLTLADWLRTLTLVLRTFVLATIAVPIVIYGLMPRLHQLRRQLISRDRNPIRLQTAGPASSPSPDHPEPVHQHTGEPS